MRPLNPSSPKATLDNFLNLGVTYHSDVCIFPDDYETEDEYTEALEEAKHAWRDTCEDVSDFGVDPEVYETEEEYSEALDEARSSWRDTCEDGADAGADPDDYDTEEEYEQALEEAKDAGGGITLSLSVECPALDKPEEIKESDFPNKRRYNAAYTLANEFICYGSDEYEQREKDCCKFILEKADTVPAANYLSHEAGFLYTFCFDFVLTSDDAKAFLYADLTKRRVHSRNDITVKVNI